MNNSFSLVSKLFLARIWSWVGFFQQFGSVWAWHTWGQCESKWCRDTYGTWVLVLAWKTITDLHKMMKIIVWSVNRSLTCHGCVVQWGPKFRWVGSKVFWFRNRLDCWNIDLPMFSQSDPFWLLEHLPHLTCIVRLRLLQRLRCDQIKHWYRVRLLMFHYPPMYIQKRNDPPSWSSN